MSDLRYAGRIDGSLKAAFSEEADAILWAEERYDREMDLPLPQRCIEIHVEDTQNPLTYPYRHYPSQLDSTDNSLAQLHADTRGPKTQFRVLTERECLMIRDALQERAQRVEQGSLEVLRSIIAIAGDHDDATLKIDNLGHVMRVGVEEGQGLRLLGEFVRRNHVVVHCTITIPEV